jgi:hypothetical protein
MRLLATISAHGLGHLAQSAPVLNALRRLVPALQLTVASALPEARLRERIDGGFRIEPQALDFGFVMHDAFSVDLKASAAAYRDWHADWQARVARTAAWLQALGPELLLCNAAYLPLAAAARLGVPAYAMSSLNWADLFAHLFMQAGAHARWAPPIHAQMLRAYRAASAFFKLRPGMDMPQLPNATWAEPVAAVGRVRRDELRERLQLAPDERVVLIAFGGIQARLPLQRWRFAAGLHWLVPAAWGFDHERVRTIESLGWPFAELLASVDALVAKPGYGSFVEAACVGLPVLYARRPDWPEQEPLLHWLHAHGRALQISEAALQRGDLAAPLAALWRQPPKPPLVAGGAEQIAARLARHGR